jgi:hypothetical protein
MSKLIHKNTGAKNKKKKKALFSSSYLLRATDSLKRIGYG